VRRTGVGPPASVQGGSLVPARLTGRDNGHMAFVADDLAAWLIGILADRGRKRLTTVLLGTDQERALHQGRGTATSRPDQVLIALSSLRAWSCGALRRWVNCPVPSDLSHGQFADLGWLSLNGRAGVVAGRSFASRSEPFRHAGLAVEVRADR
jgi:hypothetical protein